MNNSSLQKLEDFLDACHKWHESSIKHLNDSQYVEHRRLFQFIIATKNLYTLFLESESTREITKKKEILFANIAGIILFLIIGLLDSFNGIGVKIIFGIWILAVFISATLNKLESSISQKFFLQIERDFASAGISLLFIYRHINKEKKLSSIIENDDLSEDRKKECRIKSLILDYEIHREILRQSVNIQIYLQFPSVADIDEYQITE